MELSELIRDKNLSIWRSKRYTRPFGEYINDGCIIAYTINSLGCVVLIKGKRKYFSFIILKDDIDFCGHNFGVERIDQEKFLRKIDGETLNIIDKEEYERFKQLMILESLEEKPKRLKALKIY